jgi:hypothetical protein
MRFDPRLRISNDVAYELEATGFGPVMPSVVISSSYPVPLACEWADGELFVRAATGDEATDTFTTGDFEPGDTLKWPGDVPQRIGKDLTWREKASDSIAEGAAVRLWAGEVVLRTGQGLAGPFFVHELAAAAWAFSTTLQQAEEHVFECQVVLYARVRQFAPGLLLGGDKEAHRLDQFDVSPLRPWGLQRPLNFPTPPKTELRSTSFGNPVRIGVARGARSDGRRRPG